MYFELIHHDLNRLYLRLKLMKIDKKICLLDISEMFKYMSLWVKQWWLWLRKALCALEVKIENLEKRGPYYLHYRYISVCLLLNYTSVT